MSSAQEIHIAAALISRADGKVLLVRKRGTSAFMQPGGKIEAHETPEQALCRELKEELDLVIDVDQAAFIGCFRAPSANEPGCVVVAQIFRLQISADVAPAAELEEIVWVDPGNPGGIDLAPLTRDYVLGLIRQSEHGNGKMEDQRRIMFSNEILHVNQKNLLDYYEVMAVFTELHNDGLSRLKIELIPLYHVTPGANHNIVMKCKDRLNEKLTFDLVINRHLHVARFASKRDITLPKELKSCGLGTYVFSKLIEWGQKIEPDYRVDRLLLSDTDAKTEEDKKRRNDFYRSFLFDVNFDNDPDEKNGSVTAKSLASLIVKDVNTAKIRKIVQLHESFLQMADRQEILRKDVEKQQRTIENWNKQRDDLTKSKKFWRKCCLISVASTVLFIFLWVNVG